MFRLLFLFVFLFVLLLVGMAYSNYVDYKTACEEKGYLYAGEFHGGRSLCYEFVGEQRLERWVVLE